MNSWRIVTCSSFMYLFTCVRLFRGELVCQVMLFSLDHPIVSNVLLIFSLRLRHFMELQVLFLTVEILRILRSQVTSFQP